MKIGDSVQKQKIWCRIRIPLPHSHTGVILVKNPSILRKPWNSAKVFARTNLLSPSRWVGTREGSFWLAGDASWQLTLLSMTLPPICQTFLGTPRRPLDRAKGRRVKSFGFTVGGSEAGGNWFASQPVDHQCTGAMPGGLARTRIDRARFP